MEVQLQGDSYKSPSSSETTTNVWTTVDGDNVVMHTQARKFILSWRSGRAIKYVP